MTYKPFTGADMVRQTSSVDPHFAVGGIEYVEPKLRFQRLPLGAGLPIPAYAKAGDAGLDLAAAEDAIVGVGELVPVPTGFAVAIPAGHFGMVVPRSGLVRKHRIGVANSPGIIDSGYRGEIVVLLENRGDQFFEVRRGERIAQLLVLPFSDFERAEVAELDQTERGASGFGSTGTGAIGCPASSTRP